MKGWNFDLRVTDMLSKLPYYYVYKYACLALLLHCYWLNINIYGQ